MTSAVSCRVETPKNVQGDTYFKQRSHGLQNEIKLNDSKYRRYIFYKELGKVLSEQC